MKRNRVFSVYTPAVLFAFLILSILNSNEAGADKDGPSIGRKIAGTYLLTEADEGGSRIVTITADGGWSSIG